MRRLVLDDGTYSIVVIADFECGSCNDYVDIAYSSVLRGRSSDTQLSIGIEVVAQSLGHPPPLAAFESILFVVA
jgi:hypothetical protein